MLNSIKARIKKRLKADVQRLSPVPDDDKNIPTSLNDNFNRIQALRPRVTSPAEHVSLYVLSALSTGAVIEVGCYLCYSSVLMASAFADDRRRLYAIDLFDRDKGWSNGGTDDWIFRDFSQLEFAKKVIAEAGLTDAISIWQGPSSSFAEQARRLGEVGLIFIDGDHSYDGCRRDIEDYAHVLSPGGYLVFDDYGGQRWPGVKQAVDEFLTRDSRFEPLFLVDLALVCQRRI